jgi:CrcB protein
VSTPLLLGIGALGGIGASARFLLDGAVAGAVGRDFPFGTFVVNVAGAFALGLLVGATVDDGAYDLTGTGAVGAFTTFSTWALESHRLAEDGQARLGALNLAISLLVGIAAAALGRSLGRAL